MSTEREDWKQDENGSGEGQRRPYNQNREGYGNYENRDYNRSDDRPRRTYGNDNRNVNYGNRPQRSYDQGDRSGGPVYSAKPYTPSSEGDEGMKRKRPRVGESSSYGQSRPSYGGGNSYGNQGGYGNREGGYGNREGGYNNRESGYGNREGGYNNRQQGGYGNREGGYNNRQQGGYGNREGGYGNREGGYGNREGGYNRQQGGYGNREGGYNNRQGGGYNNNRQQGGYGNREGGYNNRQQGGYNNRPSGGSFNRPQLQRPRPAGTFNPNAKYSQQKQMRYKEENVSPTDPIRLNKYLANAGVCSRREADEFIQAGVVKVNGEAVTELGTKIMRGDSVMFHDQPVKLEGKVYVLLNKPKNCVTTTDDPQERMTVMNLVQNACKERIFPVGRLDRNTTGVLLLTNDGDLAAKLTHPKFLKKKIYHVWLDKTVSIEDMQKIAQGIDLEDGEIHADAISYANEDDKSQVGIEIHSGRNRVVRRIFETLGYHVKRLDRVYFAGLTKKNLPRGRWRYLSEKEVSMLRMGAFE